MKKHIIGFLIVLGLLFSVGTTFATQDIMEVMFAPAKAQEKLIDLGTSKDQVGDEVFRGSTKIGLTKNLGIGCFKNNQPISATNEQDCSNKGGDWNKSVISTQKEAPLLVRITKFILRITIVLSITMVILNGVLWIIESSKGGEVKDAKNNLIYIFVGIILSLSSVALVNLMSSLGMSSLDPDSIVKTTTETPDCSVLTEKEKNWKDKNCSLGMFGECKTLKPYHKLFESNCGG